MNEVRYYCVYDGYVIKLYMITHSHKEENDWIPEVADQPNQRKGDEGPQKDLANLRPLTLPFILVIVRRRFVFLRRLMSWWWRRRGGRISWCRRVSRCSGIGSICRVGQGDLLYMEIVLMSASRGRLEP